MAKQLLQFGRKIRPSFLSDPGNMLIVGYITVVLLFLFFGGLVASKISTQDVNKTSSLSAPVQQSDLFLPNRLKVN